MHSWPITVFAPMLTSPSCTRIFEPCPIHAQRPIRSVASRPISSCTSGADEADAVGLQALSVAQLQQHIARQQARVGEAQHVVGAHEPRQRERAAAQRLGRPAQRVGAGSRRASSRRGRRAAAPSTRIVLPGGRPAMIAPAMSAPTLAQRLLDGDRRALARAITLVENDRPEGWALVKEVYPHTGQAAVVGFTGPPGAGKSTLIGALTKARREAGRTVGVLSIDPSSPFTHGALLGDRIRLSEHFLDAGVFIRSMANRGALGGLSEAALQAALLLDAAGRQDVFVETVGVGQAEIDIIDHADTIVLVLMPGSGDSIQALKAGRDGDPGRDRDQQGRPSADGHDGPRDPRRAVARQSRSLHRGGPRELAGADRQDRGHPRQGRRRARRAPGGAPRPHPRRRTSWPSGAGATCATRCSRSPPPACAGAWRRTCARIRSFSACSRRSSSGAWIRRARRRAARARPAERRRD